MDPRASSDVGTPAPGRDPAGGLVPAWHRVEGEDVAGGHGGREVASEDATAGPPVPAARPAVVPVDPAPPVPPVHVPAAHVSPAHGGSAHVAPAHAAPGRPVPPRAPAMWLVMAGIGVSTLLAVLVGARVASLALAGVLVAAGVARLALPGPGPVGITIRSRGLDVFFFWSAGTAIAVLALTVPDI